MRTNYYITSSLSGMMKKTPEDSNKVLRALEDRIRLYRTTRHDEGPIKAALVANKIVQILLDEKLEKDPVLASQVTCKKGCYFCCQMNVDITEDEAQVLIELAKEKKIPLDKKTLQRQAKCKGDHSKLKPRYRDCVFLGKDKSCLVYEYRPMNCRKYLVADDPKLCDTNLDTKVRCVVDYLVEITTSAVLSSVEAGPMPKMLLKFL